MVNTQKMSHPPSHLPSNPFFSLPLLTNRKLSENYNNLVIIFIPKHNVLLNNACNTYAYYLLTSLKSFNMT